MLSLTPLTMSLATAFDDPEAATSGDPEAAASGQRDRRHWVRGEVRCLMCTRLVGRLLGERASLGAAEPLQSGSVSFFAYRAAGAAQPVVAYRPGLALRCAGCGGAGVLDDLEFFSTCDEPAIPNEGDPFQHRPGRRPRQPVRCGPPASALALALTVLAERAS